MHDRAVPVVFTDHDGAAWRVWDVAGDVRVAPGPPEAVRRFFVRAADGRAFACPLSPQARGYPTDPATLGRRMGLALEPGPLRTAAESDDGYTARRAMQARFARARAGADSIRPRPRRRPTQRTTPLVCWFTRTTSAPGVRPPVPLVRKGLAAESW